MLLEKYYYKRTINEAFVIYYDECSAVWRMSESESRHNAWTALAKQAK